VGDWGSKRGLRCCGSTQEESHLEDWKTEAKAPRMELVALEALRRLEGRGQQRLYKGAFIQVILMFVIVWDNGSHK
jgi:hypothetical protein